MILNKIYVDNLIKTALLEDINYCDVTTDYLIPAEQMGKGKLVAKAEGILCGVEVAARVFELIDSDIKIKILIKDGASATYGDELMRLEGRTASLLKGERTALNIIQHISGIATAANQATKLVEGTNASIADTRKTLPGMRPLQKYAVMTGGAKNHRYNLSDGVMLKDNHIGAAGGVKEAIAAAKAYAPFVRKIEIETETLDMVREAVEAGADIIMLDNMSPAEMAEAIRIIDGRAETECSGNMTIENIKTITALGVDYVSSGALTHSAPILDISLKNLHAVE